MSRSAPAAQVVLGVGVRMIREPRLDVRPQRLERAPRGAGVGVGGEPGRRGLNPAKRFSITQKPFSTSVRRRNSRPPAARRARSAPRCRPPARAPRPGSRGAAGRREACPRHAGPRRLAGRSFGTSSSGMAASAAAPAGADGLRGARPAGRGRQLGMCTPPRSLACQPFVPYAPRTT